MDTMISRTPRRKKKSGVRVIFLLILLIAVAIYGWISYTRSLPNKERIEPEYSFEYPIIHNGIVTEYGAIIENNEVKLPLPLVEKLLGEEPIHYEADSGSIILTTANKVLQLKTDSLTAKMNQKPYNLTIKAELDNDIVYLPISPIEELYGLQAELVQETGIVTVIEAGQAIQNGVIALEKGAVIRSEPTKKAPITADLAQGSELRIWEEYDGWFLVQTSAGDIGYMNKMDIKLTSIERVAEAPVEPAYAPWKVLGSKINMVWEAVYERKIDPSSIGPMQGVNVVSPTWFELVDGKGKIKGKADPAYVKWAHQQGMQVWALFSNGFEPDQTSEALASVESRFYMIQQLLAFAELYDLQGINIDFENVYTKDKENLVQFVRELTPLLHEQDLVVSIDVTGKSNSEMWSLFLDRAALGKVVDYMMVMAYDEHWAASPKAGSVASLPWTERTISRILTEDGVPPSKLVLSMPLYTRIWTEKTGEDGKVKVSSKAVGMERVKNIIAEKKLTPVFDEAAGQNYVEYKEDGALNRIWIEDDKSIQARVELARKYNLAGVATWARSFQTSSIWKTIDETLQTRP